MKIKVTEGDDTFFFGPNAVITAEANGRQVQITFDPASGALNVLQFEPHQGQLYVDVEGADANFLTSKVQVHA